MFYKRMIEMEKKGLVFNIQRYSIHDGGGIRTIIFLKGCPLACPWCANPESRGPVEPVKWVKNGKEETVGEWKTVDEVMEEIMKDEIFFRSSKGGVTLSGGEVLMQYEFAGEILDELKNFGIHTAIETTGCFKRERLESLLPNVDQVLFDLKIMDPKLLRGVIGSNIDIVKDNFEMALQYEGVEVIPRIPLIPGFTAKTENLLAIIEYLNSLGVSEVHLLPFHQYGSSKYEYLGLPYEFKDVQVFTKVEVAAMKELFEAHGIHGNVDGLN